MLENPGRFSRTWGRSAPLWLGQAAGAAVSPPATKADSARCHAVERGPAAILPPDEDPRSTSSPTRSRRRGTRAVGPTRCGGAGGAPKSPRPALSTSLPPSRVSGWPGRASAEGLGLRDPRSRAVKSPPQPSRQTSKRGLETRLWARRGGTPGSQLSCGRGSSRGGSYISHPHVRSEGGSKSLPSTPLRFFPPASAPPAAPLPSRRASSRPVLGAPRPPSRAAPRGAESSRAATRDASPV